MEFTDLIRPDLKDYCPASNLAFNERIKKLMKAGEKVYHFGFGQAPFPVVECMTQALREHAGENAYINVAEEGEYSCLDDLIGIEELRSALCDFHKRYDHLENLDPDQFIVGPGTKELIFLMAVVFNGDVLVISPSWTTYKPQVQLAHHRPHIVNTNMDSEWRITPEDIEKVISENNLTGNKLLIMCNPDNPTGVSYRKEHLQALSEVCRRHKIIVLSDEIYARLHYEQKHDTLARYYPEGTILSAGMSKWASAGGWRLGYHVYPPQLRALRDAVRSAASHTYSCAPAPMQYAVAKGLQNQEEIDSYIQHTARIMAAVGSFSCRELRSVGVKVVESTAGYYIFPNFECIRESLLRRGITTCEQMCSTLFEEARVAVMAGGPAFLRPLEELTTRLCYVNFDGSVSLEASRSLGLDNPLSDDFVYEYCRPVYDGIKALAAWVKTQSQSK